MQTHAHAHAHKRDSEHIACPFVCTVAPCLTDTVPCCAHVCSCVLLFGHVPVLSMHCRLRRALLDAEIDAQRSGESAESARRGASATQAELDRTRALLAAARAEAHAERQRAAAADAAAATSAAQAAEAQAALSRDHLDAAALQHARGANGVHVRAGCRDDVQAEVQELRAGRAALAMAAEDAQRERMQLAAQVDSVQQQLADARAAAAKAAAARDALAMQLFGREVDGSSASGAQQQLLTWQPSSPVSSPRQQCVVPPAGEGALVRCERLGRLLSERDAEARSLRQQLLELQLALSDARGAAAAADAAARTARQERDAAASALAEADAAARSSRQDAEQQSRRAAALAGDVARLTDAQREAERVRVAQAALAADAQAAMDGAASARSAQAAAEARALALADQLAESQREWADERDALVAAKQQVRLVVQQQALHKTAQHYAILCDAYIHQ